MTRLLLVGALCLGSCKKAPPEAAPDATVKGPIQVDAPAARWSPEMLAAWVAEVRPLVEKHAGRRFTDDPVVEVFDPDAFASFSRRESRLIMDAIYNDTPPEVRAKLAEEDGAIGAGGLFGKYGLFDRKTYLVPATIDAVGAERADAFGKIVLAHELVHALQSQEHDGAAQIGTLADLDHFHGWSAVSEGGANFIALRVSRDLGLEDAFWTLCEAQGWGRDGLQVPGAYPVWFRYGRGMYALEQVVATEGMGGFWRWHADPPASTSMVFRPIEYDPALPPRALDWAAVLRGADQALTEGVWMASNTRLGEFSLRGDAIRTGHEPEFEPILEHLVDAQLLDLVRSDRTGDVRVMVFDAPEHARAYLDLLRAEQTEEGRILARLLGVTVEVTYAEVNGVRGDASLLRTQRVPMAGGYKEQRTAWVARGADVVAVRAEGFRPGVRLADTLNLVFDQLDAVRAGR